MRLIAGLLAPDEGEIRVKGEPRVGLLSDQTGPAADSGGERRGGGGGEGLHIGLVFQNGALFDSLTVRENVGFLLYERTDLSEDEVRARVAESLAMVGLKGVEDRFPSELSGGMRKRVALARAIISDERGAGEDALEELVLYDEPTAGLDPVASTVIEDLIRGMHEPEGGGGSASEAGGITSYVVVTHQHSTIERAVDRLLFIHDGRVAWEGTPEEFTTSEVPLVKQFATGSLNGPIACM